MKYLSTFSALILTLFLSSLQPAHAATVRIGTISPNSIVPVGTAVSFKFETEAYGLRYTAFDDLPQSTISNSSVNQAGYFNWTPQEQDVGSHMVVFTVIDQNNTRTTLTQNFTVTNASPVSIQNISRTSAFPGEVISFGVATLGYTSPQYAIYDSFGGSSVNSGNIDSYGNFSWKPANKDVGVHNIQVTVTNSQGRRDTVYQTVTVSGIKFESGIDSVQAEQTTRIPIKLYALSAPTFSIRDSFRGNTIDSAKIENKYFIWKPELRDAGTHTITVIATNGSNISETTFNLMVTATPQAITTSNANTIPITTVNEITTSISKKYTFTTNLKIGSKGAAVTELQKKLKSIGVYSGPVTGTFGTQTRAGVKAYQKKFKITQTGTVGPLTRTQLNK